jgi:HlyD family secretion protein
LLLAAGCGGADSNRVQGYVEGEFVYVASPLPGAVESLAVERGDQVSAGAPLFALESTPEVAARNEAERRLAQARATWEDLKKPRRPTEIESLQAQLRQAQEALALSEREVVRQEPLIEKGLITPAEFDRARTTRDQDRQRVTQLQADLQTARLGARADQIEAAEANVRALEASLAKATWDLDEKHQSAPQAGLIFDTLFREGEWVPAGRPVVAILPPQNIKVRAFVPEPRVGAISAGQRATVSVDGVGEPFVGKVSFISPRAEFTPPVIYSRESRAKLVFMVEVVFEPETAARLHPGQPVDVDFGP